MRINDVRLGRFLSVDPLTSKYPMLTPYQFAANSPISGIDLDGLEYYYAADGNLLGHRTTDATGKALDNKTANSVRLASIVTTSENKQTNRVLTIYKGVVDLHIQHEDFINRANWTYGEGGGDAAEFYGHAINNLSKKEGEQGMYLNMNQGRSTTADDQKKKYFVDFSEGNPNYKRFRQYINKEEFVTAKDKGIKAYYEAMFKETFRATLGILAGTIADPTSGQTNWAGGQSNIDYAQRLNKGSQITVVKSSNIYGMTSFNIFYQLGSKKHEPEKYTLITFKNLQKVSTETVEPETPKKK